MLSCAHFGESELFAHVLAVSTSIHHGSIAGSVDGNPAEESSCAAACANEYENWARCCPYRLAHAVLHEPSQEPYCAEFPVFGHVSTAWGPGSAVFRYNDTGGCGGETI